MFELKFRNCFCDFHLWNFDSCIHDLKWIFHIEKHDWLKFIELFASDICGLLLIKKQKKMKDNKKNNSELSSNLKCIGTPCACITQNAGCILHCTLYKGCILGEKETKHRFFSYFFIYRHFTSKSVFIGEMKHSFGSIKTRLIPSYTF